MLGFGKLAAKIFGSSNEKAIKAVSSIVTKINSYEDQIKKLSDQTLLIKPLNLKIVLKMEKHLINYYLRPLQL